MPDPSLRKFFQYFPEAAIVVSNWDLGGGDMIARRYWYDFTLKELRDYNIKKKYGIYFTACDVKRPGHFIKDHKAIRAWYLDIDVVSRDEEEAITEKEREERKAKALGKVFTCDVDYGQGSAILPTPSFVIENRNGYHVYWLSWVETLMDEDYMPEGGLYKSSPKLFPWIEKNIVKAFSGDSNACKLVQLMRVPGFYNNKYGKRSKCRVLPEFNNLDRIYCDDDWLKIFGEPPKEEKKDLLEKNGFIVVKDNVPRTTHNDIFKKAADMPQEQALAILSGKPEVNGQIYTFKQNANGNLNIFINGAPTNCFIDKKRNKLFCHKDGERGSPNVIEWLKWYDKKYVSEPSLLADVLKKYFN